MTIIYNGKEYPDEYIGLIERDYKMKEQIKQIILANYKEEVKKILVDAEDMQDYSSYREEEDECGLQEQFWDDSQELQEKKEQAIKTIKADNVYEFLDINLFTDEQLDFMGNECYDEVNEYAIKLIGDM